MELFKVAMSLSCVYSGNCLINYQSCQSIYLLPCLSVCLFLEFLQVMYNKQALIVGKDAYNVVQV